MKTEDYVPFGKEWENMMMKVTKIRLIKCFLKPSLIKNKELIELCNMLQDGVHDDFVTTDNIVAYLKVKK